jgi:telomerase protein component 1
MFVVCFCSALKRQQALDQSVKIATTFNVKPIAGVSIVFCNVSPSMQTPCTSAKGLGKPRYGCEVMLLLTPCRQALEIGILLGLMCKYACEDCYFVLFSDVCGFEV